MFSTLSVVALLQILSVLWNQASVEGWGVCHLPAETGPCKGYFPKWFFNIKSLKCEKFIYGGCNGNVNRFDDKENCTNSCKCYLAKDSGPCKGKIPRWFLNKAMKCEKFIYGGCQGNENNFPSKADCIVHCDACRSPVDPGPCKAHIKRWFHNKKTKKCEVFYYGGCEGNSNNFESMVECKKICNPCYFPADGGHCDGEYKRYYYDYIKKKCKKFIYSGCGGNDNNFIRKKQCKKACMKKH